MQMKKHDLKGTVPLSGGSCQKLALHHGDPGNAHKRKQTCKYASKIYTLGKAKIMLIFSNLLYCILHSRISNNNEINKYN